jgi:hypothetical protein
MPATSKAFEFTFTDRPTEFTATEVVWPGIIVLDNRNTVPNGTTLTYYSNPAEASGFYGAHNRLYTVTFTVQSFTGTMSIQGTLASQPLNDNDWFDIPNTSVTRSSDLTINFYTNYVNFRGNFTYIRAKVSFTGGIVTQILYNF